MFHPRCCHGSGTYYPELEDINGYETEDNKLNDYGSQQANEAHIDNMIQRYKRLTLGSLDPDNVRKYQERLEYWENRKNELAKPENVDNDGERGIISFDIDELVPCLRDNITGEIVDTDVEEIIDFRKLKNCTENNGWDFPWNKPPKGSKVFALHVKGSNDIEGLIAIKRWLGS